ncbi:hypothetical protein [Halopelagius longus]|uniref:Uncharacterized protein n=2 Tax=Halopelagius longus TaxID=1236180 RepID=A0A370II15_9EURY|nr:hypothetical protein [Halopelagius longus]RDI70337.1 hypothetical protein DWB78_00590 [Halopelagius longus]
MADFKHVSIGAIAGVLMGGAYYAEGQWDPQLLFFLGLTWGLAGWLLARNRRTLNDAEPLQQILYVGLVIGTPMFSIHPELPLGDLRMALVLLTMGVAAAGIGLGAEMSEASREEQSTAVADPH